MSEPQIELWSRSIRLLHWALAISFVVAYLSADETIWLHALAGYLIVVVIGLRLLGGLLSQGPAALDQLWITPAALKAHLTALLRLKPVPHHGHHPLGALNILFMFTALLLVCLTGMALLALDRGQGPLVGLFPSDMVWHKWLLEGSHTLFANLALLLVLLHVAGVAGQSLIDRRNLSLSMITGIKIAKGKPQQNSWLRLLRKLVILALLLTPSLIGLMVLLNYSAP